MKKLVMMIPVALGIMWFGIKESSFPVSQLSSLTIENIEALTQDTENDHTYEKRNQEQMTILDDATNTYKTMIVITCEGSGGLVCP